MHNGLSQSCSKNESESKRSIVNQILSHKNSANVSEYTIIELKYKEYKESAVTKEVWSCFNIFKCGMNLLDRLDVTYQRAFMATPKDKYYNTLLNTLVDENNCKDAPLSLSNEKLLQAVGKVMEETEAEFERNINKIICNTSFQSPIQKKDVSTIEDYVYYESDDQVDTISDSSK